MEQEKATKKSMWSWSIDQDDLKNQVENYDKLKITESYRGISVLIISGLLALSFLLALLGVYASVSDIFYSLIIYIPIIIFVYRGHRWAIIALMLLWTLEKGYQLIGGGGIMAIIWWALVIPYFYKALKVENERKKLITPNQNLTIGKRFCVHCGGGIDMDSKFCAGCGKKV